MSDSSDKIVSVFLKFGADPQAIEASIASFEKIQVELQSLEKEAKTLEGQISTALAHGEDAGQLTGELKTVEAAIDNLSRKASSELGAGLNSSFEQVGRAAQRSGASIGQSFNLRDIGEKLNFVGMAMSSAGPPRPCLAIGWPSRQVTACEAMPGRFSRIEVVAPPYWAP